MKTKLSIPILLLLGIITWVAIWMLFRWLFSNEKESIDILNSFFSVLAFFMVIHTVFLQKGELELQRKELADTRKEFELQNQTLKKQRFESTFFNMISLHHEITDKISVPHGPSYLQGRRAIREFYVNFKKKYHQRVKTEGHPPIKLETADSHKRYISDSFYDFYSTNEQHLRHYFRNFAVLIKFIRSSDLIAESERTQYYEIVTAQVNSDEIALMYYYFHVGHGVFEKDIFNALGFGAALNPSLLADISHTYLLDPPLVVQAALAGDKEFFVNMDSD